MLLTTQTHARLDAFVGRLSTIQNSQDACDKALTGLIAGWFADNDSFWDMVTVHNSESNGMGLIVLRGNITMLHRQPNILQDMVLKVFPRLREKRLIPRDMLLPSIRQINHDGHTVWGVRFVLATDWHRFLWD